MNYLYINYFHINWNVPLIPVDHVRHNDENFYHVVMMIHWYFIIKMLQNSFGQACHKFFDKMMHVTF